MRFLDPNKANLERMSAADLHQALGGDREIALFDSRDEFVYSGGHILMASCVPLSRLELMISSLVPHHGTAIVWCDDGDGSALSAASRTLAFGYTNVSVLRGGLGAWRDAGYRIYEGVHVPSKAFAEVLEHERGTPSLSVEEYVQMVGEGVDTALFDTRTPHEYQTDGLPDAHSTPGPEILQRFSDLVASEETTIVVHCGGRTRSIIGAQTLIDAGVPNKVMSLRNGTQGWRLAGYEVVQRDPDYTPSKPSPASIEYAQKAARDMAARYRIAVSPYDPDAVSLSPTQNRTVYRVDVRSQAEYEAGHISGFKSVAAGQLVQETDRHLAVWNAHVVLVDDNAVRAICAASLLHQMGWSVEVMTLAGVPAAELTTGPAQPVDVAELAPVATSVTPAQLKSMLRDGATLVIDVDWSRDFFAGHIPGARWCIRSRLPDVLGTLATTKRIVFTSSDGRLAALAASDFTSDADSPDRLFLDGGVAAWRAAGFDLEAGRNGLLYPPEDLRVRAREQNEAEREAKMRAYLAWELALAEQLASDPLCRYRPAAVTPLSDG